MLTCLTWSSKSLTYRYLTPIYQALTTLLSHSWMINLGKPSCLSTVWCANKLFASVYSFPLLWSECILASEMGTPDTHFCLRHEQLCCKHAVSHQVALLFLCHACRFCLLSDICVAYPLQGMVEWEQERRVVEVDALQLALKQQDSHPVVKQTRVSAALLFLLDELHPMALSWRGTPKGLSCVCYCLLFGSTPTSAFARPKHVLPTVDVALTLISAMYLWLQVAF